MKLLLSVLFVAATLSACGGGSDSKPPTSVPGTGGTVAAATPSRAADAPTPTAAASPTTGATQTSVPTTVPTQPPAAATSPPQAPTPTATIAAPAAPAPVSFTIHARESAFVETSVHARAGALVTATFVNEDSVQHNLTFKVPGLPHGDTCSGPCTNTQTFTAPSTPGKLLFFCTIHSMVGDFIVDP